MDAGWLTRVVLVIAVVGVAAVDSISVASTSLSVQDDAVTAALAGRDDYATSRNVVTAYAAALQRLHEVRPDAVMPAQTFVVAGNGTVTVTVQRTPTTIVAHHLPWLRDHLRQQATERAVPAT